MSGDKDIWDSTTTSTSTKVFGVVGKQLNSPFFDVVRNGCMDHAAKLGFVCEFVAPEIFDAYLQYQLIQELIERKLDGIAISVIDDEVTKQAINMAVEAGIPVVTFDSDSPTSKRLSYIGTNNYAFGGTLGTILLRLKPEGGRYAIVSESSPNIGDRVEGLRTYLQRSNWVEIASSIVDCRDSMELALQQMYELAALPDIDAIVPVGGKINLKNATYTECTTSAYPITLLPGWPMFDSNSTRWREFVNSHRNLTLVVADTLPVQVEALANGYVHGLVGQVPYQMGVEVINALHQYPKDLPPEIFGTSFMEMVTVPLELPILTVDNNNLRGLRYVGFALFGIIAGLSLYFSFWTWSKRRVRVVKASQPLFLVMVAVGALIMGSSVLPISMVDSVDGKCQKICMAFPWLLSLGFTITFSALFSKAWRINRIYRSKSPRQRMKVSKRDVMVPFLVLFSVNVFVLTLWTLMEPLKYERFDHKGVDGWNRVISTYGACASDDWSLPYIITLGCINLGVLLIANWQAYESRSIQSEFSESRYIGIVMASMLQAALSGIPVLSLVTEHPQAYYLVTVSMVFVNCLSVLLLIFIPKIVFERSYRYQTEKERRERLRNAIRDPREGLQLDHTTDRVFWYSQILVDSRKKSSLSSESDLYQEQAQSSSLRDSDDGQDGLWLEEHRLVSLDARKLSREEEKREIDDTFPISGDECG